MTRGDHKPELHPCDAENPSFQTRTTFQLGSDTLYLNHVFKQSCFFKTFVALSNGAIMCDASLVESLIWPPCYLLGSRLEYNSEGFRVPQHSRASLGERVFEVPSHFCPTLNWVPSSPLSPLGRERVNSARMLVRTRKSCMSASLAPGHALLPVL